jgi:hypothetical protein
MAGYSQFDPCITLYLARENREKRPLIKTGSCMASNHWLNMALDLQGLYGLHVHSCTHWIRPRNSLDTPRIWAHIRGRYWSLVSQVRRHLCVTPASQMEKQIII